MYEFLSTPKQTSAAMIAAAEQAYDWSGVYPAACLPGIEPLAEGALSQTKAQMVRDFKRHKGALVGLRSSAKCLAILRREVPVGDDRPSELVRRFFDPDRFLVTRTKLVNLGDRRISIADTVVIKSPFSFPCGMSTNDPSIELEPDGSWALFSTGNERVIGYRRSGLAFSIKQLNDGTFTNREIMDPTSHDWAALFGEGS
jgi:hypothetical protein